MALHHLLDFIVRTLARTCFVLILRHAGFTLYSCGPQAGGDMFASARGKLLGKGGQVRTPTSDTVSLAEKKIRGP